MDPLESYLDRVCRGIAGPRSLRAHIRQELREHLKDAAAEHVAGGMPESDAIALAIEEFGGPEEVRAELEATHGHRFLTVVIDKAMSWKEKTMKARWVWSTWAHVAICLAIILEVVFIAGIMVFILPKFREMLKADALSAGTEGDRAITWGVNYLQNLAAIVDQWPWVLGLALVGWLLFERLIRSENKPLMRLAALGSTSIVLLVASLFAAAALVLPLIIAFPDIRGVRPAMAIMNTKARLENDMKRIAAPITPYDVTYYTRDAAEMVRLLDSASGMLDVAPLTQAAAAPNPLDRTLAALEALRVAAASNDGNRIQEAVKRAQEEYAVLRSSWPQPSPREP